MLIKLFYATHRDMKFCISCATQPYSRSLFFILSQEKKILIIKDASMMNILFRNYEGIASVERVSTFGENAFVLCCASCVLDLNGFIRHVRGGGL